MFYDKIARFFLGIIVFLMISMSALGIPKPHKINATKMDSLVEVYRQQSYLLEQEGNYAEALQNLRKCDSLMLHKTTVIIPQESAQKQKTSKVHRMVVVLLIIDLLGLMFFFYLERKRAYKKLVQKNIEWAAQKPVLEMPDLEVAPAELKEAALTQQLMVMLEKDRIFLDDMVNVNVVAQRLNTNRNVISRIVNTRFHKNFAALMNEYRIREAIRLLNEEQNRKYTMQAISEMCGYKNRQVFYVAFKKETGVTPTEFLKMKTSRDFEED